MNKELFTCWLEEQLSDYLNLLLQTNDLSVLPIEVQEKYEIDDCYVFVPLTDELIQHWEQYVKNTIDMIRRKETEYKLTNDEFIWWDSEEQIKMQSYYLANLCEYSPNLHKPYAAYIEKYNSEKSLDLLSNSHHDNQDDLSWLNDL